MNESDMLKIARFVDPSGSIFDFNDSFWMEEHLYDFKWVDIFDVMELYAAHKVKEAQNTSTNTGSPKLLSQLGIVEVLLRQEDCGAAHANVVALIEQLRASA